MAYKMRFEKPVAVTMPHRSFESVFAALRRKGTASPCYNPDCIRTRRSDCLRRWTVVSLSMTLRFKPGTIQIILASVHMNYL